MGTLVKSTLIIIAAGLLLGAGPARSEKTPECIKDGVRYGIVKGSFRGEWWNYQERGKSYLEGGCYRAAVDDFDRAIELRGKVVKNERDKSRARTYGMHFTDYYSHREKGVALYCLGDLDGARTELEKSLKSVDSDRGRDYLNKIDGLKKTGVASAPVCP
jgi:tetratricopeptide (TPR) repeat protein